MLDLGRLLRIDEAAMLTRRAAATIRAWIRRYRLKVIKQGRATLLRLGDILDAEARATMELAQQGRA